MAGTLNARLNASYSNTNGDSDSFSVSGQPITITGSARLGVSTELIPTGSISLTKSSITTIGYVYVNNLDVSGSIEIGPDGTNWPILLKPNDFVWFKTNNWTDVYAKTISGSSSLINYAMYSV